MLILIIIVLCVIVFIQLINRIDLEAQYLGENSHLKQEIKQYKKKIYELENDINVLNYRLKYSDD